MSGASSSSSTKPGPNYSPSRGESRGGYDRPPTARKRQKRGRGSPTEDRNEREMRSSETPLLGPAKVSVVNYKGVERNILPKIREEMNFLPRNYKFTKGAKRMLARCLDKYVEWLLYIAASFKKQSLSFRELALGDGEIAVDVESIQEAAKKLEEKDVAVILPQEQNRAGISQYLIRGSSVRSHWVHPLLLKNKDLTL